MFVLICFMDPCAVHTSGYHYYRQGMSGVGCGMCVPSGSRVTPPWGSRWPCWSRVGVEMAAGPFRE